MAIFIGMDEEGQRVELGAEVFLRHAVVLGASGSGKTVACKVLCEEFALAGLPVIAVDPQGDIASLILPATAQDQRLHDIPQEQLRRWQRDIEVVIWTPGSRAGMPLSLDPLRIADLPLRKEVQIRLLSAVASNFAALLGYPLDTNDGSYVSAYLDLALQYLVETDGEVYGLADFRAFLHDLPEDLLARVSRIISAKKREEVLRKIEVLSIGARRLLFHIGTPLDIPTLLGLATNSPRSGNSDASPCTEEANLSKEANLSEETNPSEEANLSEEADSSEEATPVPRTRISVIYLNTLHTQEEKEFFVSQLAQALYQWMIEHPSQSPQALFYIDEIAPYLPPVRKPASKEILRLLFKQARKYGICCLFASQNPSDIDYTALAQCSTWVLGRMLVQQDIRKIEGIIRSMQPEGVEMILSRLPSLETGSFLWLCPDAFSRVVPIRLRWLLTQHETLDEDRVEECMEPIRPSIGHVDNQQISAEERSLLRPSQKTKEVQTKTGERSSPTGERMTGTGERMTGTDGASTNERHTATNERQASTSERNPATRERNPATRERSPTSATTSERSPTSAATSERSHNVRLPRLLAQDQEESMRPKSLDLLELLRGHRIEEDEEDEPSTTGAVALEENESSDQQSARQSLAAFFDRSPGVYTVREITEQTQINEMALRKLLKQLQKQELVASIRMGRSNCYWLRAHLFSPDIGLLRPIQTVPCMFPQEQALKTAKRARESSLFGLMSKETVESFGLHYLLTWRIKLRYTRHIGLLKERQQMCETHLYYHAQTAAMLSIHHGRLQFVADSEQTEAELGDIQDKTALQPRAPSDLKLSPQTIKSCKPAAGIVALCEQRFGGEILHIEMAAFPYWAFALRRGEENARSFLVDAFFGHPFSLGAYHAHRIDHDGRRTP